MNLIILGVHSYLSYLRDRLVVARELLTESGSVFVQISDENLHHVRELMDLGMHFLLGAKPGDHAFLYEQVTAAWKEDRLTRFSWKQDGVRCEVFFVNEVPLNAENPDLIVNFLHYVEYDADGEIRSVFSWITDLKIRRNNARLLVRGGRARWKIENETFNTLKNQAYHYEHNYGHGHQHLSVVFAMLMMLAFLVD